MLRSPISEAASEPNGLNNQKMLRSPISGAASKQNGLNNQNILRSPISEGDSLIKKYQYKRIILYKRNCVCVII